MRTRPHRLWHGSVPADALFFERDADRRIATSWRTGASVYAFEGGLLLVLPQGAWTRAHEAPGEVFLRVGGRLTSAALDASATAQYPLASVLRLRAGSIVARPMPSQPIAADKIVDLSAFELRRTRPLAAVSRPHASARQEERAAPHEILGVERSPEADRIAADIAGGMRGDGQGVSSWLQRLHSGISRLGRDLVQALRGSAGRGASGERPDMEPRIQKPSAIVNAFLSFFNRLLITSRLANVLGRKQAEYMADLVNMLERRRFDDALRHAIPLTDEVVTSLNRLSFGMPQPRHDMTLSLYSTPSSGSMWAGGAFHERLRTLYRAAAEQLEREGKIERAAFVLADLLNVPEQAVSLLERHGLLLLAARLAEARKLDPGLIVRQWLVAGERERALAVARRYEAYETAVRRLAGTHSGLADQLRVEWATLLATRGAFAAACDVLWPVEAHRTRAREWLDEAIRRGGIGAARALARKTVLAPEEKDETLRTIAAHFGSEDPEGLSARRELLRALQSMPPSPLVGSALRVGLRTALRDSTELGVPISTREIEDIARRAGDGALRADLPHVPGSDTPWISTKQSISHRVEAQDVSASAVYDVAMLGTGLLAVAHGEGGVSLLRHDGTVAGRFHEPAHRLVLSDEGDRALALAHRGDAYRISKLDFAARTATYWLDARFDAFTDSYDGATWIVNAEGAVHAIDTNASRFESLWYIPDVGQVVGRMARGPKSVAFITGHGVAWQCELPSLTLRSRSSLAGPAKFHAALLDGGIAQVFVGESEPRQATLKTGTEAPADRVLGQYEGTPFHLVIADRWIALQLSRSDGVETFFLETTTGLVRARVSTENTVPGIRITPGSFALFDDKGRVVLIDLERGRVRDVRL